MIKQKSGRFTINGPNGAGKSFFLLKLKDELSPLVIYLPAQHELMLSGSKPSRSSGEIALNALLDLEKEPFNILLLDEWDANLSAENRSVFDKYITKLSQDRIVVEIRHPQNHHV